MTAPAKFLCAVSAIGLAAFAAAAEKHAEIPPILEWRFDGATEPGDWEGRSKLSDGPQPPEYPTFSKENQAAYFSGKDAHIVVKDHEKGGDTNIRFGAGESITVETWVEVKSIGRDHMAYLLGKGRHVDKGEVPGAEMNQNYAVRLKGAGDGAQLGFLFTSQNPADKSKRNWHRWWSNAVVPSFGWHHIALTYTFGKADSLRAFVDGVPTKGVWDMGGATDHPPVTDADDLVIGTGYRRSANESFSGWMDDLVIYRGAVAPETLTSRYAHNAPPPPPPPPPVSREMLTPGKVLMQISEKGVPEANSWPARPKVTKSYEEVAFGFFDWPQKYISTGVRADRSNPSLVRAAALVDIPKGKHRLLLRGRGAARLSIDGKRVLETPFPSGDTGGHGHVSSQDKYLDLGPDFRFVPPGNREKWTEFESKGGEHFVVLETMIGGVAGGSKRRPEFGETVVAISLEGEESWSLLTPGDSQIPYTDEGWAAYETGRRAWLAEFNAKSRAKKRAEHADYWTKRRQAAEQYLTEVENIPVPALPEGFPAHNEIDHFLGVRIASVKAESQTAKSGTVDYFEDVEPLLKARCYDCHQGGKAKGDLRLDQHASALEGGKSDGSAIMPGDPVKSALTYRVSPDAEDDIMPPKGEPLSEKQVTLLEKWIEEGAHWPQFDVKSFDLTPLADDLAFLRRVTLDTVGVTPTEKEIDAFLADDPKTRRSKVIDRLLADPRWADHWMGYWQDVLAENPNIINPTLNNTGPFRWWIYESLLDNKPADLFVTELVRMEGSERFGGPAGFGTATSNDVPMAAKGIIVSSAFLGVEMKCARCHDSPSNISKQEDLFQLAAMLKENPIKLPTTSSVPMDRLHQTGRKPLIEVTLKPGSVVKPAWPFERFASEESAAKLAKDPKDIRDRLAALITAPENERFAQVIVNRIWQRLMGRGIVEKLSDWEKADPSHPDLLKWLGHRLIASGYDMKAIAKLILNSHAYQRAIDPKSQTTGPLYIAPAPRRLSAEQIVDSLFHATGKPFELEEVSLDIDSVRALKNSLTLGKPKRAWMLASTSNERDRPSLSLPRIQAVASVMETFGWRGSRQDPVSIRPTDPNVLQPAILANGTMGIWLTRLSNDHGITQLALEDQPVETLIDRLFHRLLTREPSKEEKSKYAQMLSVGYEDRVVPESDQPKNPENSPRFPVRYVSWSNHLDGAANLLAQEKEAEARRGDPPTNKLTNDWRLRMEDVLWAMLNAPEWIYTP